MSAQSFETNRVMRRPPSGSSVVCCESCQMRARTTVATRAAKTTSIRSGSPLKTPIDVPKSVSGSSRVRLNVSSLTERRSIRSVANVRNSS